MKTPTAEQVGDKFAEVLQEWIGEQNFKLVQLRNRRLKDDGGTMCCASHDFCDANMAMEEAMKSFNLVWDQNVLSKYVALWNAAWNYAKDKHLTAEAS